MIQLPVMKFVFDRRGRASNKKEGSVELQIYYAQKRKWVTTGVRVLPKQWRNGNVVNRLDAALLNESLSSLMSKARKVVNEMLSNGEISLDLIAERLIPSNRQRPANAANSKGDFIAYCEERAAVRKYGKSLDSCERYDRFLRWFTEWSGITRFDQLTEARIIAMDKALVEQGLKDNSKWNNYHRFLNSFIIDAIDDGLLRRNPYKRVHINKEKDVDSLGKHLTPDEFHMLESFCPPTASLERVRDLFVFQVYTCLSYTDLAAFDASHIREIDGKAVYSGSRGKTGIDFTLVLLQPAKDILDKYNSRLPLISNVKYNQYLKALAQHVGIDKPLSSHWARHTGATLLLNNNVNMEVVAKVLGHSSTSMTRKVYAKLLDETVVKAMSGIKSGRL